MTVIEIVLICLIAWVASMIGIAKNYCPPFDMDEWIEIVLGGLLLTALALIVFVLLCGIVYGLWTAPWHDWFYSKLW